MPKGRRELRGRVKRLTEPSLASDEQLILHSQGSYKDNSRSIWKLGHFYLTNHRLLFFIPSRILFETPLANIKEIRVEKQEHVASRIKDAIAIGYQSPITQRLSKAWIIIPDLELWRKKLFELTSLGVSEESLNKVMEELDPISKEIVAYLWQKRHATINELTDLIDAPSHMHLLLRIRDTINPVAERIIGNPLLVFERSKMDPDTGEQVLFSWWMVSPKEPRPKGKEALLDIFDEGDYIQIIAELVGIAEEDIVLKLAKDKLTISASCPDKSYYQEVILPAEVNASKFTQSYTNGVLVVRIEKL